LELAGRGLLAVLAIDVKQLGDAWRRLDLRRDSQTSEPLRERVADAREALGAESGNRLQPPIVCGRFELGECFESQLVVQPLGEDTADARHRCQERHGIGFTAQSVEHRESTVCEKLANGPGDALADVRQLFQPFQPLLAEELVHRRPHRPNGRRGAKVCTNPEWIGTLISEQASRFLQAIGDLFVDARHAATPEALQANGAPS
jgi:hypothetical protein